jgi:DNA-binding MarR family transcriptional regulator
VAVPDRPSKESPSDAVDAVDAVDEVLLSFQILQMHTSHVTSTVSSALGIGASEFRLLLYIASGESITPKLAGDFLELTSGTITSLVDRMVAAGLVERVPNPDDRRSLILQLAPDGEVAVERVTALYRSAFRASIPAKDLKLVAASLSALGEALAAMSVDELTDDSDA